ncbi:unnamed protein product [Penicillium nalgiovense]|nr:unnamed protein product [Penicillium nalgiovense]
MARYATIVQFKTAYYCLYLPVIGIDIRDNKCSWLVNKSLLLASPEQRHTLNESYGRKDCQCEMNVRHVFVELDLQRVYKEFEDRRTRELQKMSEAVDETDGLRK